MNKTMEKELKIHLKDAGNLKYLLEALPPPVRIVNQVNHYFDTPALDLRRNKAMVRLRESSEGNFFTLKRDAKILAGYLTAEDHETRTEFRARDIGPGGVIPVSVLPPGIQQIVAQEFGLSDLKHLGRIRNERRVIPMKEGFTIELDETHFPNGQIDHEIEVETADPDAALPVIERILDACGIPFDFEFKTKYSRFLEAVGIEV